MRPLDFATQLNVSLANGWGIVRTVADLCLKMPEGKYVLIKDPNKVRFRFSPPVLRSVLRCCRTSPDVRMLPPSSRWGMAFSPSLPLILPCCSRTLFPSRSSGYMPSLSQHSLAKKKRKKAWHPRKKRSPDRHVLWLLLYSQPHRAGWNQLRRVYLYCRQR